MLEPIVEVTFCNLSANCHQSKYFTMNANYFCLPIFLFTLQAVVSMFPPEIEEACKKENGFDNKVMEMDFNDASFPKGAKCFLSCGLQKMKMLREDGTLDKDAAISHFANSFKTEEKKNQFIKTVNECDAEVKVQPDVCDTAFEYAKCKKTKMPED